MSHAQVDGDPFVFTLVLKPILEAVKEARDVVGFAFEYWGMEDYSARLVVSELVTNAVRASDYDQYVVVRAFLTEGGVPTVEVWDQAVGSPHVETADLTAECGRGLLIVEDLVTRWGTRPMTEGGKVVWAQLPAVYLEEPV